MGGGFTSTWNKPMSEKITLKANWDSSDTLNGKQTKDNCKHVIMIELLNHGRITPPWKNTCNLNIWHDIEYELFHLWTHTYDLKGKAKTLRHAATRGFTNDCNHLEDVSLLSINSTWKLRWLKLRDSTLWPRTLYFKFA